MRYIGCIDTPSWLHNIFNSIFIKDGVILDKEQKEGKGFLNKNGQIVFDVYIQIDKQTSIHTTQMNSENSRHNFEISVLTRQCKR